MYIPNIPQKNLQPGFFPFGYMYILASLKGNILVNSRGAVKAREATKNDGVFFFGFCP